MRSLRFQFIGFITTLLVILLVLLNIFPITSSRDRVFEEKKNSLSSQAAVVASSHDTEMWSASTRQTLMPRCLARATSSVRGMV